MQLDEEYENHLIRAQELPFTILQTSDLVAKNNRFINISRLFNMYYKLITLKINYFNKCSLYFFKFSSKLFVKINFFCDFVAY